MFSSATSRRVPTMISAVTSWGQMPWREYYDYGAPTASAFAGANYVRFDPIFVPAPATIRRAWWANGPTTTGGASVSVALYASTSDGVPGVKIVECAATTQGTASQVQFVDIADTWIGPGSYWIALAVSSVTNTTFLRTGSSSAAIDAVASQMQQTGITVGALPSPATPDIAGGHVNYFCGFATTASP